MSSKNQSESTAAAQEELTDNSLDTSTEAEPVDAVPEANGEEESAPNDGVAEAASTEEATQGQAEFKVTDKRRAITEETPQETADDDDEEVGAEFLSEAFEIDLNQIQLEAEAVQRELEEMRAKLKESEALRAEAMKASEEYADRFRKAQLQLRAETEEVRARMQRTFEQRLDLARGDVVAGLLDTLDNLQRAVGAADAATDQGAAFDALRDGVRATAEMFENQLKKLGLQAVVSEGEQFNPEIHDAVELAAVPKEQDGRVLAELQRGYKFGERLLRPARVKVGRGE